MEKADSLIWFMSAISLLVKFPFAFWDFEKTGKAKKNIFWNLKKSQVFYIIFLIYIFRLHLLFLLNFTFYISSITKITITLCSSIIICFCDMSLIFDVSSLSITWFWREQTFRYNCICHIFCAIICGFVEIYLKEKEIWCYIIFFLKIEY